MRAPFSRFKAWVIKFAQRLEGYPPEHSLWHHAAICQSNGYVIEAVPGAGVTRTSIRPAYDDYDLRTRSKIGMTHADRNRVVRAANERLMARINYDYRLIFNVLIMKYTRRLNWLGWFLSKFLPSQVRECMICTTLCRHSYAAALRIDIFRAKVDLNTILPAHISASDILGD
jgi:hypothetical protein